MSVRPAHTNRRHRPRGPGAATDRAAVRTAAAEAGLLAIIDTLPRLFFKLKALGDRVYAPLGIGAAERGILRDLDAGPPLTAPELAARRPVSRQAVQPILTRLAARGLIAAHANERHRRSPRYAISAAGRALLGRGRRHERAALAAAPLLRFDAATLETVLDALRAIDAELAARLDRKP